MGAFPECEKAFFEYTHYEENPWYDFINVLSIEKDTSFYIFIVVRNFFQIEGGIRK
jgi:hypothetical protein